jgi:hypothetical protein
MQSKNKIGLVAAGSRGLSKEIEIFGRTNELTKNSKTI